MTFEEEKTNLFPCTKSVGANKRNGGKNPQYAKSDLSPVVKRQIRISSR